MMNSAPAVVGASDGLAAFRSIIAKRGPALAWARGAALRFSSRAALLGTSTTGTTGNIVVSVSVTTVKDAVFVREVEPPGEISRDVSASGGRSIVRGDVYAVAAWAS